MGNMVNKTPITRLKMVVRWYKPFDNSYAVCLSNPLIHSCLAGRYDTPAQIVEIIGEPYDKNVHAGFIYTFTHRFTKVIDADGLTHEVLFDNHTIQ
jgi:hypothetical protein